MQVQIENQLCEIAKAGLEKRERVIHSPQRARITLADGRVVLNLCANNYLGLADHPAVMQAAKGAIDSHGCGLASVRFICGTQDLHTALEREVSQFLGTEDTILYSSCFDANGGLFETLLGEEDAVISDALNHASIIDGIRLCKAKRLRFSNNDMSDLEAQLVAAKSARFRMIASDGVFSMDGVIADLKGICALAERHDALVMIDDSHAVGLVGPNGRGTPELHGVADRVDLITGTFGKALGGGGGYTSGRQAAIDLLRQRSRPYLFSNSLPPSVAAGARAALKLAAGPEARERLWRHARRLRSGFSAAGLRVVPGEHPIIPVMIGDAPLAVKLATRLLELGVYVIAFSYPVVPQGAARIRVQASAALADADVEFAIERFAQAGHEVGVI